MHVGLEDCLYLGNLDARRDWGHARDFVRAQWLMLQQDRPEDFVIATGEQHSVREFCERAARRSACASNGAAAAVDERGIDAASGRAVIKIDPRYFRPTEVDSLLGDASKARRTLGWEPQVSFDQLVEEMVREDVTRAQRDALVERAGFKTYRYHE